MDIVGDTSRIRRPFDSGTDPPRKPGDGTVTLDQTYAHVASGLKYEANALTSILRMRDGLN